MDLFIERAIEDFKKSSNVVLTEKSKKKIYELFPVPREQKILWADNIELPESAPKNLDIPR